MRQASMGAVSLPGGTVSPVRGRGRSAGPKRGKSRGASRAKSVRPGSAPGPRRGQSEGVSGRRARDVGGLTRAQGADQFRKSHYILCASFAHMPFAECVMIPPFRHVIDRHEYRRIAEEDLGGHEGSGSGQGGQSADMRHNEDVQMSQYDDPSRLEAGPSGTQHDGQSSFSFFIFHGINRVKDMEVDDMAPPSPTVNVCVALPVARYLASLHEQQCKFRDQLARVRNAAQADATLARKTASTALSLAQTATTAIADTTVATEANTRDMSELLSRMNRLETSYGQIKQFVARHLRTDMDYRVTQIEDHLLPLGLQRPLIAPDHVPLSPTHFGHPPSSPPGEDGVEAAPSPLPPTPPLPSPPPPSPPPPSPPLPSRTPPPSSNLPPSQGPPPTRNQPPSQDAPPSPSPHPEMPQTPPPPPPSSTPPLLPPRPSPPPPSPLPSWPSGEDIVMEEVQVVTQEDAAHPALEIHFEDPAHEPSIAHSSSSEGSSEEEDELASSRETSAVPGGFLGVLDRELTDEDAVSSPDEDWIRRGAGEDEDMDIEDTE